MGSRNERTRRKLYKIKSEKFDLEFELKRYHGYVDFLENKIFRQEEEFRKRSMMYFISFIIYMVVAFIALFYTR